MPLLDVPVSFKELFTTKVSIININPNFTVSQMLDTYSDIIKYMFDCENFILIPTNQVINETFPPETGYVLERSNKRLRDLYGNKLDVSFYVKDLNKEYQQLSEKNILYKKSECFVCFDEKYLCNRFGCQHFICDICYDRCSRTNRKKGCPQCSQIR